MSKAKAVILGIFTVWPIIYLGYYFYYIIPWVLDNGLIWEQIKIWLLIHGLTALLCLVLFFYYLVHVLRNKALKKDRTMWILLTIFLNALAWPVYWYLYIWKKIK